MIEKLVGNDVDIWILNSNDLSMAPYFQKSHSVYTKELQNCITFKRTLALYYNLDTTTTVVTL